jgi:membrane-bound serine protease (ClpP class)
MVLLLAILLFFLVLSPPWAWVVLAIAIPLEIVELRLLRRWARRLDRESVEKVGMDAFVGATAEVVEPCLPRGWVMVRGELWEASSTPAAERGEQVRVVGVDGLRLRVAPLR